MRNWEVHKFGGAALKDAEGFLRVQKILETRAKGVCLLVVVSATGKTTNSLEKLIETFLEKGNTDSLEDQIFLSHQQIALGLSLAEEWKGIELLARKKLQLIFNQGTQRGDDAFYDSVAGLGEWLSSELLLVALKRSLSVKAEGVSAESWLFTDNRHREARVDFLRSGPALRQAVADCPDSVNVFVTQGFIGRSNEGNPTTLGREGSDYSAAIAAWALSASRLCIWKDVPGVLNADPKLFPNAILIPRLGYLDAVELAYFGASVIHPRTLLPLEKASIPLEVRSFYSPEQQGTLIGGVLQKPHDPAVIVKSNQSVLLIQPRQAEFLMESSIRKIFSALDASRIRVNLMQHTALRLLLCVDKETRRQQECLRLLEEDFLVDQINDMALVTIRNFTPQLLSELRGNSTPMVFQESGATVRFVMPQRSEWDVRQWT
jgi:aspartate kinase